MMSIDPLSADLDIDLIRADLLRPFHSTPQLRAIDIALCLRDAGIACYVTGGAVRDWLYNRQARDIDFSVESSIDAAVKACNRLIPPVVPKVDYPFGIAFMIGDCGVIDLSIMRCCDDIGESIDIVSYTPGASMVDDGLTRDFSINAFFLDPFNFNLYNPFPGALEAVQANSIDLITDCRKVYADYRTTIRILQFIARGYNPTPRTMRALMRHFERHLSISDKFNYWVSHFVPTSSTEYDTFKAIFLGLARGKPACGRVADMFNMLEACAA